MPIARRYLSITAAIVLAWPFAVQADEFSLKKTQRVLSELIEKALADNGIASMSIALVKEDEIVWKAAFGYSNLRTRTKATPDTIYSTGSSFKSVTATALMQLQEQGKLGLTQPINRYLAESRVQDRLQSEKAVTFEHILSHWSGLLSGATTEPIWGRKLPATMEEFTSRLYSIRAPEEKWEYNNFAYGTAGLLVEKISGQEYEAYMVEHVLAPLGVTTPHPVYPSPDMVENLALPYSAGGTRGKPAPVAQVHFDVYPAGDIYLTAEDMARYLGAHLNGGVFNGQRILSEESVADMHRVRFGGGYSLGFWVETDENGNTMIQHGGAIPGQRAMLRGDLDAKVGVYYMTNSDVLVDDIDKAAIALLRGEDYTPPPDKVSVKVDRRTLDRYVGTYSSGGRIALTILRDGQSLLEQAPGSESIWDLTAESDTTFYHPRYKATLTFGENEEGEVDHVVLDLGEEGITLERRQ